MNHKTIMTLSLLSLILLAGCAKQPLPQEQQNNTLHIAATFYPLYDLTKTIVGDKGTVYAIVPAGAEPHDYEPNPSDFQSLEDADAFVTMGIAFAAFEDKLKNDVPSTVTIIPAGTGIQQLKASDAEETLPGGLDPHIWLSPKNAQVMVTNIMNGLIQLDPDNQAYYQHNGQALITELQALDDAYTTGLQHCDKDAILVTHNAFSYLARDYGFRTIYISGLEPEAEPTPQQLATLIDEAKTNNMTYVFYEELVDPRIANTIAKEVGAKTAVLSPLEGTTNESATYDSLMRQNLHQLEVAMGCQ